MKVGFILSHLLLVCIVHGYIIYQKIPSKKRFFFYDLIYGFKPKLSKSAVRITHSGDLAKELQRQRQKKKHEEDVRRKRRLRYRLRVANGKLHHKNSHKSANYSSINSTQRHIKKKTNATLDMDNPYNSMKDVTNKPNRKHHRTTSASRKYYTDITYFIKDTYRNRKSNQIGLSEEEKYLLLEVHNDIRRNVQPPSSNMRMLEWDDRLADIAQRYAEKCIGRHNPQRSSRQTKYLNVGENIYYTWRSYKDPYTGQRITYPLDVQKAVESWDTEKYDYEYYQPLRCGCMCGHYTQAVTDVSYAIGCGTAYCPKVTYKYFSNANVLVCNYGEGYNTRRTPYLEGTPCSACDSQFPACVKGLCTKIFRNGMKNY